MSYRNYPIITGIFLLMAGASYWAYQGNRHPAASLSPPAPQHSPDFFMEDATVQQYTETGQLEYQLSSKKASHYPHNDTSLLSLPHMTSYRKKGQIVTTDALNGKLLHENEKLILWDSVVIIQHTIETGKEVRMDTEYLTLNPVTHTAETDQPVLITSNNSTIRAIGMEAFYEQGLIHLKARVRGFHEPD